MLALTADELRPGVPTPGVVREAAFETGRARLIRARAAPHAVSDRRHGDRDVLARGRARFEFGPGGPSSVEVGGSGFFRVPTGLVHRDVDPFEEPQEIVLAVVDEGRLAVDLDGRPDG